MVSEDSTSRVMVFPVRLKAMGQYIVDKDDVDETSPHVLTKICIVLAGRKASVLD